MKKSRSTNICAFCKTKSTRFVDNRGTRYWLCPVHYGAYIKGDWVPGGKK